MDALWFYIYTLLNYNIYIYIYIYIYICVCVYIYIYIYIFDSLLYVRCITYYCICLKIDQIVVATLNNYFPDKLCCTHFDYGVSKMSSVDNSVRVLCIRIYAVWQAFVFARGAGSVVLVWIRVVSTNAAPMWTRVQR